MYHNVANSFSRLSESTFHMEISQFFFFKKCRVKKYKISCFARNPLILLRTPYNAIFVYASKIDNVAVGMLHCITD